MYWYLVKLIIYIAFVAGIVVDNVIALNCVSESPCTCHLPDGSFYDLSKVSEEGPFKGEDGNFMFSFQPCKDVKMTLGNELPNSTSACNNPSGVSLCAKEKDLISFSLGNTSETKWNLLNFDNPELILTHGNYTTRVTLSDCSDCTTKMMLYKPPKQNKLHFLLTSPNIHKTEGLPEGISTGSVMVILLFVFSGVYLIFGALALRFFRGAIGWELIPNYDFWSDLPALVRDGVAFTFSGCSVDSYDRI